MSIYLVRHAKAGERDEWDGDDRLRPLSMAGLAQAERIADSLASYPIRRIISSPYRRCVETVAPLARRLRLRVEEDRGLAEGAGIEPALRLIRSLSGTSAVLCTHGDVVQELLEHLAAQGVVDRQHARQMAKGSTWVLDERGGRLSGATYLPAP
ncbi:MAG TPA: phosphoglycerate mutase family protein [Candidatus Limnocylindrales bacterium]|nr:phosphoglycerate mutase family protein [Candidatus Limnocylindrales bacterium]